MNNIDLTSSRVLKGSMKFTPKIGKKDKTKKSKKSSKVVSSNSKKTVKKSVSTTNEPEKASNKTIDLETINIEDNLNNVQTISKSIAVNTIKDKNTITPSKENNNSLSVISSTNKKVTPIKEKSKSNLSKTDSISKSIGKSSKVKQIILEDEEDTISEVSDDYLKTNSMVKR